MLKKYLFLLVIVIELTSCAENKQPNVTNNIKNVDIANDATYTAGKKLHVSNFETCHPITKRVCPQMLIGVEARWKNKALLYEFIKNLQVVTAKNLTPSRCLKHMAKLVCLALST